MRPLRDTVPFVVLLYHAVSTLISFCPASPPENVLSVLNAHILFIIGINDDPFEKMEFELWSEYEGKEFEVWPFDYKEFSFPSFDRVD